MLTNKLTNQEINALLIALNAEAKHLKMHKPTHPLIDMYAACGKALIELQECRSTQHVIPEQRSPISFDALMAAVSEVTGAKSEFDATPEKGYQAVPFMNFNSLSRIVEMFRTAQPVIPDQPDSQDLELWIDMLENSDSDDEDGELNNTQLIMWLKELQRRRALSAQPVIPEQPELRYGDNVLWFLNELASFDASDIDSDDFDVYGEGRNGTEGCATISITELAADAAKLLSAQPVSEHKPYAWAIEHKVGLPTVVFNKPNTNSWAFKDAVIKELYEAPEQESE